jgi:glycosyltransferase involved in cell wall biosynthesis
VSCENWYRRTRRISSATRRHENVCRELTPGISQPGEHERIHALFRPSLPDIKQFIRKVSIKVIPGSPKLIGAGWREQWRLPRQIAKDNLVLLHSLCNTAPLRMTIPSIVTLHDVIALTEPQAHYNLSAGSIALKLIELYGKLTIPASARQASAIITVSSYEKEQIIKLFNLPSDKVFVTHLAPSLYFKPILPDQRSAGFIVLEQKYGIKIPYLIGVGFEPRKNIDIVIQAYVRLLNNESSKILNLVLVCAHQGVAEKLRNQIDNLGLKGKALVLTGVRNDDLNLLYGLSSALIFPSRREGFGYRH